MLWCFLLAYSFSYLFTSLLTCFFKNRPIPFPGQRSLEATKPGFSYFLCLFCVIVDFVTDA